MVLLHTSNNIKITKYASYEPLFNSFFQEITYLKYKIEFLLQISMKKSIGTHWTSLFIDKNTVIYFDSFGIKYIPQEVSNKIKNQSITHNITRIQSDSSIMCGFYCFAFIEFMLTGKTLLDNTNLFSPNNYKNND